MQRGEGAINCYHVYVCSLQNFGVHLCTSKGLYIKTKIKTKMVLIFGPNSHPLIFVYIKLKNMFLFLIKKQKQKQFSMWGWQFEDILGENLFLSVFIYNA